MLTLNCKINISFVQNWNISIFFSKNSFFIGLRRWIYFPVGIRRILLLAQITLYWRNTHKNEHFIANLFIMFAQKLTRSCKSQSSDLAVTNLKAIGKHTFRCHNWNPHEFYLLVFINFHQRSPYRFLQQPGKNHGLDKVDQDLRSVARTCG